MAKLMDVKMSCLDNDAVIVSVVYDGQNSRESKTYGFGNWADAIQFLSNQTAPAITLEEVKALIAKADKEIGDGCPG